jgi:hypothetical protein
MTTESDTRAVMLAIDDIRFVKELYPRLREDDATVERYQLGVGKNPMGWEIPHPKAASRYR